MKVSKIALWLRWVPALGLAATLAACGGSDGAGTAAPPPVSGILGGTAAVGDPIVGGTVRVRCAGGDPLGATTSASGSWEVNVSGQTLPCAVQVSGGTVAGTANTTAYHSIALALGNVNITPLTDLVTAALLQGAPADWFASPDFAAVDAAVLETALGELTTALGLATALGSTDPLTAPFAAEEGDTLDDILTALRAALATLSSNHAALLAAAADGEFGAFSGFGAAFASALANPGGGDACTDGTRMVYALASAGGPFSDGQEVCVVASSTSLAIAGKTLTDPVRNEVVSLPFSAYAFSDGDLKYEVVFNDGALYEINVLGAASAFFGQLTPAP